LFQARRVANVTLQSILDQTILEQPIIDETKARLQPLKRSFSMAHAFPHLYNKPYVDYNPEECSSSSSHPTSKSFQSVNPYPAHASFALTSDLSRDPI